MNEKALVVIALVAATIPLFFSGGWVAVTNPNAQQQAMTTMDNQTMEGGGATNETMTMAEHHVIGMSDMMPGAEEGGHD